MEILILIVLPLITQNPVPTLKQLSSFERILDVGSQSFITKLIPSVPKNCTHLKDKKMLVLIDSRDMYKSLVT